MSAIGLYGSTPEDPSTVGRFALHVAGGLEREPLPPSRLAGYTFPAAESAARLRDGVKRIDASVALLANESKENAESKVKRDEAIQAFDEVFQRTANLTSVLLEVAALPELAAKVRPSPRRPGSTVAIEEEVRAAEGETPAPPVSAPG